MYCVNGFQAIEVCDQACSVTSLWSRFLTQAASKPSFLVLYYMHCSDGGWVLLWNHGRGWPHQNCQNDDDDHPASNCEARRWVSVSDSKAPNTNIRQGAPRQIYHNLNNCLVSFWCSSYFWIYILQHKTGPADISMLGGLQTPLMTNTSNTAPHYCPEIWLIVSE